MGKFDLIAFDADDTLWHNEFTYRETQEKYLNLLSPFAKREMVEEKLFSMEMRNLRYYGYGIKSFTLSMIENAIEISQGRISAEAIRAIIEFGREMIMADVELIDGVTDTVQSLAVSYELIVITKGDLLDQEAKLARSGLGRFFKHFEVVSHKEPVIYKELLDKYEVAPERFLMIGNSLKSDVLPVIEIGGYGIHIPYQVTWAHELVHDNEHQTLDRFYEVERITEIPKLIDRLHRDN
jgi:putative hydrolase of the HAD superfamily